jgi:predicted permease
MMRPLRRLFGGLRALARRDRVEHERDEELRAYLESLVEAKVRAGMSPGDALRDARAEVGSLEALKEQIRDIGWETRLEGIWRDVRYAARTLRRAPAFTATAVITLALGIGANTALFTIVDQVLVRLLPVDDPRELVSVSGEGAFYGDTWGFGGELSYPMYEELGDRNQVFAGMFARFSSEVQARAGSRADRIRAEYVTGSYFPVLGVHAALGRTILPSDDAARPADVAVLSHAYWRAALGGDPGIIGRSLVVNNRVLTVVGVAQEGFDGTSLGVASQMFVPIRLVSDLTPLGATREGPLLDDPRIRWAMAFGRLRPGVGLDQAQARLQPLFAARIATEVQAEGFASASAAVKTRYLQSRVALRPAGDGRSFLRQQLARPLWILTAIVAVVLLIACANLANLLLARGLARQRELALRMSLGAGRRRLVRQLVVESVLLAAAGGLFGLVIATWGAGALLAYVPNPDITLTVATAPDARILAFTTIVAMLTGLGFGLAPALRSTRPDLAATLRSESGSVAGGGQGRLRRGFMLAQVALSVLLLAGAGLFVRSLSNLMHTNLGIDTAATLSFRVDPETNGYAGERGKAFIRQLRERLAASPGVSSAAFATQQLLTGSAWSNYITVAGQPFDPDRRWFSYNNGVSPGFFATMGIRVIQGRDFDDRDQRVAPDGNVMVVPRIAIANRTFVEQYLAGRPALGARVGFGRDPGTPTPIEIVGVVADAAYTNVRDDVQPQLFFPFLEGARAGVTTMYVRATGDAASTRRTVEQVVRQLDAAIPIYDVTTMEDQVARSLSTDRLIAELAAVFGALATLLAMIGLYGVLSYTVARRTREIGTRMALGALTPSISWMVLREVLVVIGAGVAIALPAVWALTGLVKSQLYGVTPMDPLAIAGAITTLALVAALAALVPAYRAARVDPVAALRSE